MSDDDEFDDLFSFSSPTKPTTVAGTGTTAGAAAATAPSSSASGDDDFLDFDLDNDGDASGARAASAEGGNDDDDFLDMFGDDSPPTADATSSAKAGSAARSVEDEFDDLLSGLSSAPAPAPAPAPAVAESTKETSAATGTSAPTSDPAAMFDLAGDDDDDDSGNAGTSGITTGTTATAGGIGSAPAPATATVQVPAPVAAVVAAPPPVPASNPSSMPKPAIAASGDMTATSPASAASPESVAVTAAPAFGASHPAAATALTTPEAKVPVVPVPAPAPARPPAPAPLPAPALVHADDDFHVHDAETREMLDFLGDDDDESNKDRSGDAGAEATNVSGTATPATAATIGAAEQEEDHDDDDFGAFATAESVQEPSPSGLSSSRSNGMLGGGVNVADRIELEDNNVDGSGFDFEKDILGVVPTEEDEMAKNAQKEKEEEERKNIATAAAAVEGTSTTTDSPETMNKSKPSLLATKANGTTSIPSIRNLSISSKPGGDLLKGLSNPLRRKTESHGEKGGASSDDKSERAAATSMSSSTTTAEEASASSVLVESTASASATTQKVKGGMGSFLSSMKPRKMPSVGGSGSLASPMTHGDATSNTANITNQETTSEVSVAGGADSTGATDSSKRQATALPPKPIPPPVFNSISEAIRSPLSTTSQIFAMVEEEREKTVSGLTWVIAKEDRPFLWCKLLSGKTLDDLKDSSLADGFAAWDRTFTIDALERWLDNTGDNPRNDGGSIPDLGGLESSLVGKVLAEGRVLAKRTVEGTPPDSDPSALKKAERDLCSIVLFHYRNAAVAASAAVSAGHPAGRRFFGSSSEQDESMERIATSGSSNADAVAKNRAGGGKKDSSTEESVLLSSSKGTEVTNEKSSDDSQKASKGEDSSSEDSPKRAVSDQDEDAMAVKIEHDAFLAPVVSTLLSASIPAPVASVVLTRLFATALPLMALSDAPPPIEAELCEDNGDEVSKGEPYPERTVAARSMHASLYLLACYHLPVLVTHLDRYCPGWHWPRKVGPMEGGFSSHDTAEEMKEGHPALGRGEATDIGRNPQNHGFIPMSWFVSHLAGQTGSSHLEIPQLLCLWDTLLTGTDLSIKFFLALAVLDSHTDTLLMLSGAELGSELNNIMSFGDRTARVIEDEFIGGESAGVASSADDDGGPRSALEKVEDWLEQARVLEKSTPKSVLANLRAAEDAAVAAALERRRAIAEQRLKAKLEAEKQAHRKIQAELRKQRNDEAKRALIRARLTQYYRRNAPEKIDNIDKIMIAYAGRYDVLDKQLKEKYGHGFLPHLPTINPQLSSTTNKLLSSMGTGLKDKKSKIAERVETVRKTRREGAKKEGSSADFGVAVRVKSEEVLPILCAGHTSSKDVEDDSNATAPPPSGLKFYLIDSRPDDTASEQGRFPTSVGLSPEALMDPERIHGQVELFESLRSAVHIVVMGEGFSHFPSLFDHRLTPREQALAEEDDARTSLCALFFIKRGYPFVSILDGGFAAAHSWLARNAPSTERCAKLLSPSTVLVDYDCNFSTFAQLEAAYQEQKALASASTTERTSKALQKIIDSSMTGLTVSEGRIEELYAELASVESRQKARNAVSKQTAKVGSMISGLRSINVGGAGFAGGSNRSVGGGGSIASSHDDVSFSPVAIAEAESQNKAIPTALSSFGNPFSKNTADEKKEEVDDPKSSAASRKQSMKVTQQPDRFKKINFPSFASASKAAPKRFPSAEEKQPSMAEHGSTSAPPTDPSLAVKIKPTETGKFSFLVSSRPPASKPTNDPGAALTTATEAEQPDVDAASVPAKHSFSFLASSKKQIVDDSAGPSTAATSSSNNTKKAGEAASRFGDAFSQARESLKDPLATQVKNPFAKLGAKDDADLVNEAEEALDEDAKSPSTSHVRNLKMSLGSMSLPGKGFSFATAKASLSSDTSRQNTQETGQSLGSKLKLKVGGLGASKAVPVSAEEHEETEEESISFHSEDDGINED